MLSIFLIGFIGNEVFPNHTSWWIAYVIVGALGIISEKFYDKCEKCNIKTLTKTP